MKTVFVIGAGANIEIDMPGAEELKERIIKALNFSLYDNSNRNMDIYFAMQYANRSDRQIKDTANIIKEALPHVISIDNFIDTRRNEFDIALCGKIAIVHTIFEAEKKSSLYKYLNDGHNKFLKTWYPLFFKKISENCDINEFIERVKDISFIIFNYDRCFEYYMARAIHVVYKVSEENAKSIIHGMNIIHPYGKIGDFDKIPLGAELNSLTLLDCASKIRTFTEDSEETKKERSAINHLISNINRMIFLGFAYHPMNLDILFKNHALSITPAAATDRFDCYGTGYEISEKDRERIKFSLRQIDPRVDNCDIDNVSCTQFFKDFWYRLSFRE